MRWLKWEGWRRHVMFSRGTDWENHSSQPSEDNIRRALARILQHAPFRTSKRSSEFLQYVVDQTLLHPGGTQLKERTIGVAVFHLPCDYDTNQHALVRVTASEIRKKLAQYYQNEGSDDPVRIDLPCGAYGTSFRWTHPGTAPAPIRTAFHALVSNRKLVALALGAAVLGVLAASSFFYARPLSKLYSGLLSSAASPSAPRAASGTSSPSDEIRIAAGSSNQYVDRDGRVWLGDRYFAGGDVLTRPEARVLRTTDPDIYRSLRYSNFHYNIPLKPGVYELHLHFAEITFDNPSLESSGEGERLFDVYLNDKLRLNRFDIISDAAGSNTADERVFKDVAPAANGFLHLEFRSYVRGAVVSGIEVLPGIPGKMRPVRIAAGGGPYYDRAGNQWEADGHFLGGNAVVHATSSISLPVDRAMLCCSARRGHFSYAIPVTEGKFRVTLMFCLPARSSTKKSRAEAGPRGFDVYCNGVALLRDFDIVKEADGEGRILVKTFHRIKPSAQGKLVISFVPVARYAIVNGIEIVDESQ